MTKLQLFRKNRVKQAQKANGMVIANYCRNLIFEIL